MKEQDDIHQQNLKLLLKYDNWLKYSKFIPVLVDGSSVKSTATNLIFS